MPYRGHTGPLPGALGCPYSASDAKHEPNADAIANSSTETAHQGTSSSEQS